MYCLMRKRFLLLPMGMEVVARYAFKYGTLVVTSPAMEGVVFYLTPEQLTLSIWKLVKFGMLKLLFKWPWRYLSRWLKLSDFQDEKLKVHAPKPKFTY